MEEEEDAEMPAEELAALRLRAEAGDTQAQFELGCELDGEESAVYFRRAAEGGHARAMVCYAEHLRYADATPEQEQEAAIATIEEAPQIEAAEINEEVEYPGNYRHNKHEKLTAELMQRIESERGFV